MKGGGIAERIALTEDDFIVQIPDGVDTRDALGLGGSTGITAWMALEWTAKMRTGDSVLILGATGPVGLAAVSIAKILGAARVVAAGRNAPGLERCRLAGADAIVNVATEERRLVQAFTEATRGGADVIFDPVSGKIAQAALGAAKAGARFVQIGRASGEDLAVPPTLVPKSLTIAGYANFAAPAEVRRTNYRKLLENVARGTVRAVVQTHALANIENVWESTKGSTYAKIVIEPNSPDGAAQ